MSEKKIKFSHIYPKLWNQTKGELLAVRIVNTINESLIEYDTFWTDNKDVGYYSLPNGEKIQLIFLGDKLIPFCTIRRYTKEKYEYYQNNIGEIFDIVVEEVKP